MGTNRRRRTGSTAFARAWTALLALLLTAVPCTADFVEVHAHDGLGLHLHLVSAEAAQGHAEFHARAHAHEDGGHHEPPRSDGLSDGAGDCDGLFVDLPGDPAARWARAGLGGDTGARALAIHLAPLARFEGPDPPAAEPWRPPPRGPCERASGVRALVRIGRSLRL